MMVQNSQKFVAPCDLVFDIEEDVNCKRQAALCDGDASPTLIEAYRLAMPRQVRCSSPDEVSASTCQCSGLVKLSVRNRTARIKSLFVRPQV